MYVFKIKCITCKTKFEHYSRVKKTSKKYCDDCLYNRAYVRDTARSKK